MERTEVAVRYCNGKVLQGSMHNFLQNNDHLLLFTADNLSGNPIKVLLKEIEALYVVQDLALVVFRQEKKKWSVQAVTLL